MRTIHGTALSSGLKYRFFIATLLVYIVYSHWRHNNKLSLIIDKARSDLVACQNYAESLIVKLLVVFEHKKRLEKIFNFKQRGSLGRIKVHERMLRTCQENLTLLSAQIHECHNDKSGQINPNDKERKELEDLRGQVAALTSLNSSLNEIILKKEKLSEICSMNVSDLQNSLSACQEEVKKYVGAIPVADYTQNKTAYFDRKYKVGDTLAFDRDRTAFKPPTLLPAKELVGKLADKMKHLIQGEETNLHPDDRQNNDDYMNNVPDVDEKDYKEQKNDVFDVNEYSYKEHKRF